MVVELNTDKGYLINQVTGDSIQDLINTLGVKVKTGVPLPMKGRVIDPETVARPLAIPTGDPGEVPANLNVHRIPEDLPTCSFQITDLLESSSLEMDLSSFVLLNYIGDTVPTGIPVPAVGREVPCIQPRPVLTIAPGIHENASIDIHYLDVYHGMISSQVISLLEDSRGNIWFGSIGGGAARYDGKTLAQFSGEEGLSGSWITAMLEDSEGKLWFGTVGEGVIQYDGETFTHFSENEGLSNNTIEALHEDSRGNLWIGTTDGGVSKYDGSSFTHYTIKEGLSSNRVLSILEDRQGNLWFGTLNGVSMYNGEVFRYYSEGGSADYPVNSILEDRDGNLWFGTAGGGARRFNGESYVSFTNREGLSSNMIEAILEDSFGNLWFGTTGGGVSMYRGNDFTHFSENEGLSGSWIISILEDRQLNLWFGSLGNGVSILNNQSFRHFTEKEGLNSRAIYSILEDSQGKLWFGSMYGGVSMYDGESFRHYTEIEGLAYNTVESILEDGQGNLWFGLGTGGVSMYNGKSFTHFTSEEGFSNSSVGSMLEDGFGNLWFGTYGEGLIKYNGTFFTHFTEAEGLASNMVESLLEDDQGRLWIGTLGGVSMYKDEEVTNFSEREGLSSNLTGCIMEDSRGNLWFGTMTMGVCMFDGSRFTIYTKNEGLGDNHIQSIVEDSNGSIWLSTGHGLNMIDFTSAYDSVHIHSYGLQDGLKGIHFLQNSVLSDSKGRLWWGSNAGLTMLDINAFETMNLAPDIALTSIDINGAFINYRSQDFGEVASYHNYPLNLELPYYKNHLTFHSSAIDWKAPHKIRYSYRITGLDASWSDPTKEAKADYRNLPYGKHRFEMRAIGEAQVWSDPMEYTFTINPPWWHTWWARAAYGILGLLLVLGVVHWRTFNLKNRQKELENTVRERTVEISEKNEELEQQNLNLASQRDEIHEQKQAITDSIEYAKRIQTATLPPYELLSDLLPNHFLLYRPLQIVSGDFYWLTRQKEKIIVAVADCTGHGVPGAFMSMLGSALLNDIVNSMQALQANLILNELRDQVIISLRQTGELDEARDGMDISLCVIDEERMQLQYAGANNPLYHFRDGRLTVVKADMMPIGISSESGKSFTNHQMTLQKEDTLYLFTDGFVDQFGGERRKRFMTSRLKAVLTEMQDRIMFDQKTVLERTLDDWMGLTGLYEKEYEQIDDIVIMGIKV